jgi:hypothetical protein
MQKISNSISRMEQLIETIEKKGMCLREDKWIPTTEMLDLLIRNAEHLGIDIKKSYQSVTPEDLAPVFNKMNLWMEEIIGLQQERDALTQENAKLKKDIEEMSLKSNDSCESFILDESYKTPIKVEIIGAYK